MSALMIRMAQRASEDNALMASLITRYGEMRDLNWEEIATQLRIDDLRLARLALCRRPDQSRFPEDVTQIADFVGIDKQYLISFIQAAESAQDTPVAETGEVSPWRKLSLVVAQWRQVSLRRRYAWAVSVVALFLVLLGVFLIQTPIDASGGTLIVSDGQATISWVDKLVRAVPHHRQRIALVGEVIPVKAGDTIVTEKGTTAQLHLLDGSTVDLFEGTKLEINDLSITRETYRVRLRMQTGRTANHVLRSLGVGDVYEIITPSARVSVRGTVFTVEVLSLQQTYTACDEGVVSLLRGSDYVELQAGEEAYAYVSRPLVIQPIGSDPPEILDYPTVTPPVGSAAEELPASGAAEGESEVPGAQESDSPSVIDEVIRALNYLITVLRGD